MIENKIIVADDIFSNLFLITDILDQLGYEYKAVNNGKKLIEELKTNSSYTLVFTDIEMPVMSGIDVARTIRKDFEFRNIKNIPIIALTAHNINEIEEKLTKIGFNHILSKPYSIEKFDTIIKEYTKQN